MASLYAINDEFEGTIDEAMAGKEYHFIRELTEAETEEMVLFGCGELEFIKYN